MGAIAIQLFGVLVHARSLTAAAVLGGLFGLSLRFAILAWADRERVPPSASLVRLLGAALCVSLGGLYAFVAPRILVPGLDSLAAFGLFALLALSGPILRMFREPSQPGIGAFAVHCLVVPMLAVAGVAAILPLGFLEAPQDRVVLVIEVTGETRNEQIRWQAPNQDPRDELLVTHRVVFRDVQQNPLCEAWVYGDEIAVKGRVLRFSSALNRAGVENLFELLFAHNGYSSAERHASSPHQSIPLTPQGSLVVHPLFRPLQKTILELWERDTTDGSDWIVRSVTTESTYFPLSDVSGAPARATYRLVLTPGGLSAS